MSNLKKNEDYQKTSNIVTSMSDTSGVVLSDIDINKTSYKKKYESLRYFVSKVKEITNR